MAGSPANPVSPPAPDPQPGSPPVVPASPAAPAGGSDAADNGHGPANPGTIPGLAPTKPPEQDDGFSLMGFLMMLVGVAIAMFTKGMDGLKDFFGSIGSKLGDLGKLFGIGGDAGASPVPPAGPSPPPAPNQGLGTTPPPPPAGPPGIASPPPIVAGKPPAGSVAHSVTVGDVRHQEIVDTTLIALSDPAKLGQLGQSGLSGVTFTKGIASFSDGSQTRYFQQIAAVDGTHGTTTGLKATAWIETNAQGTAIKDAKGKSQVHLEFAGYTGSPGDGSAQTAALAEVANGKLNPQAAEAAAFTDRVIRQMGKDHISNIVYGAHSLGASNALAAHVVSDLEGVHSQTTLLIEPAAATQAVTTMEAALRNPASDFSKQLQNIAGAPDAARISGEVAVLNRDIGNDTVSIREVVRTGGGLQGTLVSTMNPGGGMDAIKQQVMGEGFARMMGGGGSHDPAGSGGNGMLGQIIFDDVTGHQNIVSNITQNESYDKNHLVANIRDAALNNDPMLNSLGQALTSSGVVYNLADGVAPAPAGPKSPPVRGA